MDLIPRDSFKTLLESLRSEVHNFPDMVRELWSAMDKGTFSPILRQKLRRFNGGLFEDCEALPLTAAQLELLIDASKAQWRDVEPAIFGTLLERALDPVERHKLGAHLCRKHSTIKTTFRRLRLASRPNLGRWKDC